MGKSFEGKVQRAYTLEGRQIILLQPGYRGDLEAGEPVEVELSAGMTRGTVHSVAWGSAFRAESPPLTIVLEGLGDDPEAGAKVYGL